MSKVTGTADFFQRGDVVPGRIPEELWGLPYEPHPPPTAEGAIRSGSGVNGRHQADCVHFYDSSGTGRKRRTEAETTP